MDLLKEIKENSSKDSRSPEEQIKYLKQLGIMMFMSFKLYREHVVSFCSTLIKLYDNLNSKEDDKLSIG